MSETKHLVETVNIPVRWGDMDAFGHVNNSRYFTYFEQARVIWFERMGVIEPGLSSYPILFDASCRFIRPVTYPATVAIKVYIAEPGNSSFMTYYELDVAGEVFATGSSKVVWVDYKTGRSQRFPDTIRQLFEDAS